MLSIEIFAIHINKRKYIKQMSFKIK